MPKVTLNQLEAYLNDLLQPEMFNDYCPNGLQVEGKADIRHLISGVTASQALIDKAVDLKADALLVHHGYFWKGEDPCVKGIKRRRIASLLENNISLLAYHLPLDAHREFGNNACFGRILSQDLGLKEIVPGEENQFLWQSKLKTPLNPDKFKLLLANILNRSPESGILHIDGACGDIKNLAWCTGAAQGYIDQAADLGLDAFISGEISEQTVHIARERGIHYFSAGHHATERYGVQALGQYLSDELGIEHQFIDIDNPV